MWLDVFNRLYCFLKLKMRLDSFNLKKVFLRFIFQTSQPKDESNNQLKYDTLHAEVEDDLEKIHENLRKVFESCLNELSKKYGH